MQECMRLCNRKAFFLSLLLISLFLVCGQVSLGAGLENIRPEQLQKLSTLKIFFGHQSVGNNIMKGVGEVLVEYPQVRLHVLETRNKDDFRQPVFAHASVGKNNSPQSKIDDFVALMDGGLGNVVEIAFLKFCFVDVNQSTDIEALFKEYSARFSLLKKKYPDTVFVHLTVPLLRRSQAGFLTRIKKTLKKVTGKKSGGFFDDANNIARNRYNEKLINYYQDREPIFDIAALESTHADNTRAGFTADGQMNYVLAPEYTEDGGHLNSIGRKFVAEQLLIYLSGIR